MAAVRLLPAEQLLRQLLLDCRNHILSRNDGLRNFDIWFSGGWVRDKLLGGQSPDIDVTVSKITAIQFGETFRSNFNRYVSKYKDEAEKSGIPATIAGFHEIRRQQESDKPGPKNIDIASAYVFGLSVDFVGLCGACTATAKESRDDLQSLTEDAYRRDATINALYYNLDSQRIEDYTGKGLSDIAAGIVRTTMEPYQHLLDDPLRALRLIRFASKFGFQIDQKTQQSMQNPDVHATFEQKTSRERVRMEVEKIVNGPNPRMAFALIHSSGLYSAAFLKPSGVCRRVLPEAHTQRQSETPWPYGWPHALELARYLLSEETGSIGKRLVQDEPTYEVWLMAVWAPLTPMRHKSADVDVAVKAAKDAMKCSNNHSRLLRRSLNNMDSIMAFIDKVNANDSSTHSLPRSAIGMTLRSWGSTWKLQVLYSLLAQATYHSEPGDRDDDGPPAVLVKRYSNFMDYIWERNLQDAHLAKPLLDGGELLRMLNSSEKRGAAVVAALDELVGWQFDHENVSKREAKEWFLAQNTD